MLSSFRKCEQQNNKPGRVSFQPAFRIVAFLCSQIPVIPIILILPILIPEDPLPSPLPHPPRPEKKRTLAESNNNNNIFLKKAQ